MHTSKNTSYPWICLQADNLDLLIRNEVTVLLHLWLKTLSLSLTHSVTHSVCVFCNWEQVIVVLGVCLIFFHHQISLIFLNYSFSKCLSIPSSTLSQREETEMGHFFHFHYDSLMLSFPFPYRYSILWNVAQPSLSVCLALSPLSPSLYKFLYLVQTPGLVAQEMPAWILIHLSLFSFCCLPSCVCFEHPSLLHTTVTWSKLTSYAFVFLFLVFRSFFVFAFLHNSRCVLPVLTRIYSNKGVHNGGGLVSNVDGTLETRFQQGFLIRGNKSQRKLPKLMLSESKTMHLYYLVTRIWR